MLITGIAGCAGSHLAEFLQRRGAIVSGIDARPSRMSGLDVRVGDVRSGSFVADAIAAQQPDDVFHLAALIPGPSASSAEDFLSVNITGTFNVLDAVRRLAPRARVLVASSSAVYGKPDSPQQPIDEKSPMRPQSIYAVSKATQDIMAMQFATAHGLHVISARTFNQTGPREPDGLVCATIAAQIARIERGLQEPELRTVTLVPRRDFTDVRDVVAGYSAALEHGSAGAAYNICSGRAVSVKRVVDILLELSRVRNITIVETGPPPGPQAIMEQRGDARSLHACSGWQPRIPLEDSLAALLDERRAAVAGA